MNQVREGGLGYNAATNKYEDLLAAGVVDPAKVTRSALQNAASIAGLLLTTEALIAEKPEKGIRSPCRRRWRRHGGNGRRHGRHVLNPTGRFAELTTERQKGRGPQGRAPFLFFNICELLFSASVFRLALECSIAQNETRGGQ